MAKPRARLALCACAFILLTFQSTCLGGGGEDVPGRTGGASTAAPQVHEAPPSGHVCDGGAVSVPMEFVNDDYCDCKDGSDEIKTSACAHTPAVVSYWATSLLAWMSHPGAGPHRASCTTPR